MTSFSSVDEAADNTVLVTEKTDIKIKKSTRALVYEKEFVSKKKKSK